MPEEQLNQAAINNFAQENQQGPDVNITPNLGGTEPGQIGVLDGMDDLAGELDGMVGGEPTPQQQPQQTQQQQQPQQPQQAQQQQVQQTQQQNQQPPQEAGQEKQDTADDLPTLKPEHTIQIQGANGEVKDVSVGEMIESYNKMHTSEEQIGSDMADISPEIPQRVQQTYSMLSQQQGLTQELQAQQQQIAELNKIRQEITELEQIQANPPSYNPQDPESYEVERAEYVKQTAPLPSLYPKEARLREQHDRLQASIALKEKEVLFSSMDSMWPELANPATRQQEMTKINKHLANYGFTPQDINEFTDPRAYMVIRDAMQYRAMRETAKKNLAKTGGNNQPNRFKVATGSTTGQEGGPINLTRAQLRNTVLGNEGLGVDLPEEVVMNMNLGG